MSENNLGSVDELLKKPDLVIVGGGINGLLLARELSQSGAEICLVEKGEIGREASWAGGGIISPLYPWRYSSAVTALAEWAQSFYPQLAAELLQETGIDCELSDTGLLMLDANDEQEALAWAKTQEKPMLPLEKIELQQREAALAKHFKRGLWMPKVSNVRNPRLIKALKKSLELQPDVNLLEHSELQGLGKRIHNGRLNSAKLVSGERELELSFDRLVFCSGAWTGKLTAQMGHKVDVNPVKGQMLLYKLDAPIVNSIVLSQGRYLIPRLDNHLLVGSTLEYCHFNKDTTTSARESLLESAHSMVGALQEHEPIAQWSGLRPQTPDGIPYIGKLPEIGNVYINAGQYRNGLVLAPASARLMADILLNRETIVSPDSYDPTLRLQ